MKRGLNKVLLIGHLGQDPEVRYMPNGTAVCNFTVATTESWKNKQTGNEETSTEWHRCVTFGRLAEICGEYLRKGSKVYLEGQSQTKRYEKEGITQYSQSFKINEMQMLDSKGAGSGESAGQGHEPYQARQVPGTGVAPQKAAQEQPPFDDDIPF